jgi:RNA polymerase sigma-70 factor (ECF subfamily)
VLTTSAFPRYKHATLRLLKRLTLMDERVAKWPERAASSKTQATSLARSPVDLSKESDIELMSRLSSGQQEALSPLFDRYHRLVLSIAAKIVRDRTEAEDLMQDVFFEVYRFAGRFDPNKGAPKTWIMQFAYSKSLKRRRYLALRRAFEDSQIQVLEPSDPSSFPQSQYEQYSTEEMLLAVQHGLAELTPGQREVVQLACFEGFLFSEIAERTHDSLGNVRHHYYRGIEKLRDFVKRTFQLEEKQRSATQGGGKK